MKKNYILLVFIFVAFAVKSQTLDTLRFFDFNELEAGDNIAASYDAWQTWSGSNSEDGVMVDDAGNIVFKITKDKDVVMMLADSGKLETGRYKVSFDMKVDSSRQGYFNILHSFAGADTEWALNAFYANDLAILEGGVKTEFEYTPGEWYNVSIIIDLDANFITYYHNNKEIHSWKFSAGPSGGGSSSTLGALNLYGYEDGVMSEAFFDNILVTREDGDIYKEKFNFSAEKVERDIIAKWDAIAGAEEYILVGGNGEVPSRTSNITDTIENIYPGNYQFAVGTEIDEKGYFFSEAVEINVAGGVDRNIVVFEAGTGTWCVNCPATARGFDQMHAEDLDVAIVEYHSGDDFENIDARKRISYYGISGYPTSYGDGSLIVRGGSYDGNQYSTFKNVYDKRMKKKTFYTCDVDLKFVEDKTLEVGVDVENIYPLLEGDIIAHVAVVENGIDLTWQGVEGLNGVTRKMYPNADGTTLVFDDNNKAKVNLTVDIPEDVNIDNSELVVFLQHANSKEILNGFVTELSTVGIDDHNHVDILISPNPVSSFVTIEGMQAGTGNLYSINGSLVKKFNIHSQVTKVDLSELHNGSYYLVVVGPEGVVKEKIIVLK